MNFFMIFISALLVNNFVMSRFLGICPFLGVSNETETALGMGIAVTFVIALATAVTYIFHMQVLVRFNIEYMQTVAFILIIASLVQLVEMFIKKTSITLYNSLGIYLPLITTNCAVLGVAVLNIQEEFTFLESMINSVGAALGFTLAIVLFAGIRERIAKNKIAESFSGFPIALITAGLMSIAFLGFQGLL